MKGKNKSNPCQPIRPNRAIDNVKDGKVDGTRREGEESTEGKVDKMIAEEDDEGVVTHQRVRTSLRLRNGGGTK